MTETTEPRFAIRIAERQTGPRWEAVVYDNGTRLDTISARSMVVLMQHVRDLVVEASQAKPKAAPKPKPKAATTTDTTPAAPADEAETPNE